MLLLYAARKNNKKMTALFLVIRWRILTVLVLKPELYNEMLHDVEKDAAGLRARSPICRYVSAVSTVSTVVRHMCCESHSHVPATYTLPICVMAKFYARPSQFALTKSTA